MPGWVFLVALGWALLLLVLFVVWVTVPGFRHAFPHSYGHIPVEVPWFGAVGGCLVSFGGIFRYNREWNPAYDYWHPVRPLIGMFTGAMACVLLLALLRAAAGHNLGNDPTVYDAAAFVFGFAESAFRQLIKALTDIFVKPGGSSTSGQTSPPPAGPRTPLGKPSGPSAGG
jgi:hypothetical protein